MKAKRRKDGFDCLAFKDHAQLEIYEATRNLPRSGFRQYLHRMVEGGPFSEFWKELAALQTTSVRPGETR